MTGTMRVAVYRNNHDVRIEERPIPKIGARELLAKVHASGICGSDVLEWYRVPKAPVVLGHEIGAEIVEVGKEIGDWRVGDRVFVSHHVPCEACASCRSGHETVCETLRTTNFDPGGFAEYVRVPEVNVRHGVFRIPNKMTYETATFVEPFACVIRGQRAARGVKGKSVLILGCGVAGLLHIRLARMHRAAKIWATDVQEFRRKAALSAGPFRTFRADAAWDARDDVPELVRAANDGRLADLVITCTGAPPALDQAFRSVAPGGMILFFAPVDPTAKITIPFNDLWRNEVTTTATYGAAPRNIRESIGLIDIGSIGVSDLVTHTLPLADAAAGFALVAEGRDSMKVVLKPHA